MTAEGSLAHPPGALAHLPVPGHGSWQASAPVATPARTDLPVGPLAPVAPTAPVAWARPAGEDAGVDWGQVRAFRQQAAELLTAQLRDRAGLDEPARREIGRALIVAMLRDHADSLLAEGAAPPSAAQERVLAAAIFDALFGLGRLQPLVDDPDVENIEITGCDRVHLVYGDGRVRPGPPVADSDEELIEALAFLAAGAAPGRRFAGSPLVRSTRAAITASSAAIARRRDRLAPPQPASPSLTNRLLGRQVAQ